MQLSEAQFTLLDEMTYEQQQKHLKKFVTKRKCSNLTQSDIAEVMRCQVPLVSLIENGKKQSTLQTLKYITAINLLTKKEK